VDAAPISGLEPHHGPFLDPGETRDRSRPGHGPGPGSRPPPSTPSGEVPTSLGEHRHAGRHQHVQARSVRPRRTQRVGRQPSAAWWWPVPAATRRISRRLPPVTAASCSQSGPTAGRRGRPATSSGRPCRPGPVGECPAAPAGADPTGTRVRAGGSRPLPAARRRSPRPRRRAATAPPRPLRPGRATKQCANRVGVQQFRGAPAGRGRPSRPRARPSSASVPSRPKPTGRHPADLRSGRIFGTAPAA